LLLDLHKVPLGNGRSGRGDQAEGYD